MANPTEPLRDNVFRMLRPGGELRDDGEAMPTLTGHLAVFNQWAKIDSRTEGRFLERIAPGAFTKTISESASSMRALFQHGQDPQVADKPLGPIAELREDDQGVYYEVPLLDTSYNRDLLPGLRAGLYGSSFRFGVVREKRDRNPKRSEHNPEGWPERTVTELRMREFGPVTFPAYAGATAGVRSITDDVLHVERLDAEDLSCLAQMIQLGAEYIEEQDEPGDEANIPRMEAILALLAELVPVEAAEDEADEPEDEMSSSEPRNAPSAPADGAEAEPHPEPARRASKPAPLYGADTQEVQAWRLP